MKTTSINICVTFTEALLGSASGNKDIHEEFIAAKAHTAEQAAEELAAIPVQEQIEKSMTIFPRDEQGLFLWDYQVRGFLKESLGVAIELGDSKISKWGYKRAVDSLVFVNPRRIYLKDEHGQSYLKAPDHLQRPLRADTMQGERVALANSEMLPAGTTAQFTINVLEGSNTKSKMALITADTIKSLLDYGQLKGFGQWRSGGHGRFTWEEVAPAK